MPKNICVISPACSKESAERLAYVLKGKFHNQSVEQVYDFRQFSHVINYGWGTPILYKSIINTPKAVSLCVNKISTLKRLSPLCSTIQWTKDKEDARMWFDVDGIVVARQSVTLNQGKGLFYCSTPLEFEEMQAKLWTRYFHSIAEVRLDIYKGEILAVYKKRRTDTTTEFDVLQITEEQPQVKGMIDAIQETIGIDFYGLDVLVNSQGVCKMLELNSAPILHPPTEERLIPLLIKEFT